MVDLLINKIIKCGMVNMISVKTAYNGLKELSAVGSAYPADGAVNLIQNFKYLFIGHKLDAILSTRISDFHFSVKKNQTLQKDLANYIEWEGPFVFIINNQRLFIDFSAPKHYNIGINSQDIHEIINISAKKVSEIEMCRPNGQFLDLSFLYGPEIIGQNVRDIHTVVDDKSVISSLSSVIIELQNNFCLVISEEIDNPMLRIYANIKEALEAIDKLK